MCSSLKKKLNVQLNLSALVTNFIKEIGDKLLKRKFNF